MLKRPKQFELLAGILLLIAASFPLQVMVSFGFWPTEIGQILAGMAPLNWVVLGWALVHGVLVYLASPLVLASAPLFIALVAWNNWVVAAVGLNVSTLAAFAAVLGAAVAHIPLLDEAPRRVLLNPKLRWWRTAPRRRAQVLAVVRPVLGGEVHTSTFDISVGGAFLSMEHAQFIMEEGRHSESRHARALPSRNLKVGTRCSIRLVLDQLHIIQCGAEIVRHAQPLGNYPGGLAVRFICLDDAQKKMLNEFVKA